MRQSLILAGLALLVAGLAGCSCGGWQVTQEVTPWFQIEEKEPYFELPHALRIGEHGRRARVRRGARWHVEDIGGRWGTARPLAGGTRALVRDGLSAWRVYLENRDAAVPLEEGRCSDDPVVVADGAFLLCTACRAPGVHEGPCSGIFVSLFDADGALEREGSLPRPPETAGCVLAQLQTEGRWSDDTAAVSARLDCEVAASGLELSVRRKHALWSVSVEGIRTIVSMAKAGDCLHGADWHRCLSAGQGMQLLPLGVDER